MTAAPRTPRPAARWALLVFLLVAALGFIALGLWQVERLGWKRELIARVEARVHAEPVPLPPPVQWDGIDATQDEYRRVTVQGRLLHGQEVPVYASTERGPGYWIMTPMATDDGTVWINRGFVDNAHRAPASRARLSSTDAVSITGLLRMPDRPAAVLRDNVPAEDRWYLRVPVEMAVARDVPQPVAPFFIDAQNRLDTGNWPVPGMTMLQFRDSHLSYALTWFAMALLALLALVFVLRSEFGRPPP